MKNRLDKIHKELTLEHIRSVEQEKNTEQKDAADFTKDSLPEEGKTPKPRES